MFFSFAEVTFLFFENLLSSVYADNVLTWGLILFDEEIVVFYAKDKKRIDGITDFGRAVFICLIFVDFGITL